MVTLMIIVFVAGYLVIALEHPLHTNKAASALLLCALMWTLYVFYAPSYLPGTEAFQHFAADSSVAHLTFFDKIISYVTNVEIIEHTGDIAEILFFLMGAMTIVELIDVHGGFNIITERITTKNKRKLLWLLTLITFMMSAILDNLTTSIVMVMLLRKLIANYKERWLFACVVIIAANSGGAFSPIGDVTSIMLWVKGNVTTAGLIPNLILPSIISVVIPVFIVSRFLKGNLVSIKKTPQKTDDNHLDATCYISNKEQKTIFFMGVGSLIFVPIFKSITHLPPFIGVLLGLSVLWIYTEILYQNKKQIPEHSKARISVVLGRIDIATILFFLGILMAVAALQSAGILQEFSVFLAEKIGNVYLINILIGLLSSIVDNVPLVAGAIGMYPLATGDMLTDPYWINFAQDGIFWLFLSYCAGVGGSILIIGSAAGVVVMGLEKVNFIWYLKNISLLALLGYLSGAGFFYIQEAWIRPLLGL
jgi:Na+/H+ antiporter NhaD/arsenite permease-like protein